MGHSYLRSCGATCGCYGSPDEPGHQLRPKLGCDDHSRPIISSGVKVEGWKEPDTMLTDLPVPARGKVWVADVPESLGRFYTLYDNQGHLPRAQGNGFIPDDPPAG